MFFNKIIYILSVILFVFGCKRADDILKNKQQKIKEVIKKKVLYIDSNNRGYKWSDDITEEIIRIFNAELNADDSVDNSQSIVDLRIFRMNSQRDKLEENLNKSALEAKAIIDEWKPDIVITSDDIALKYLIVPYFKNVNLPFVFCGVDWSIDGYGFPYRNVTGIIEVSPIEELLELLRNYSMGNRVGFIATDKEKYREWIDKIKITFDLEVSSKFADNFNDWKQGFKELQRESDIVIISADPLMTGWNKEDAVRFIEENIQVPTGAEGYNMESLALITINKIPQEQGQWVANTTLRILNGEDPVNIDISRNRKANFVLNSKLADKLNIHFPVELIKNSMLGSESKYKVLFINSYHKGYGWSDGIERGLLKALSIKPGMNDVLDTSGSHAELKIIRMDTKNNKSENYIRKAALEVKNNIDDWSPDIVITADDNAVKYVYSEYFSDSSIPFVFCGVNWDASVYGIPKPNITGMVEVDPAIETIQLLKEYSKGTRLGYIGVNSISENKTQENYEKKLNLEYTYGRFVDDFEQWKIEYMNIQNKVDILLWQNPVGIKNWDDTEAIEFIMNNTKIPSGTTVETQVKFALIGRVKVSEEQGEWAGKTALNILKGVKPSEIPITRNKESKLKINLKLAERLNIVFPEEVLNQAALIGE